MKRSPLFWFLPLVFAIHVAACGDGPAGNEDTSPPIANVSVGMVWFQSVRNGTMDPAVDTVATGGTMTWTWVEAGSHTVRFEAGGPAESPLFEESGSVFSQTFPTSGTYAYDCGIHGSSMTGTVVVKVP